MRVLFYAPQAWLWGFIVYGGNREKSAFDFGKKKCSFQGYVDSNGEFMLLVQVHSLCWAVSPWGQQQVPGIQQLLSSVSVWKWNALFSNLVLEHSSRSWKLEMFASFLSSFSWVGFCWPWGNAIHGTKLFSKFSLLSATPCFITVTKYQRLEKQSWKSTSKKHGPVNKHSQNFWPLPHGQWLHRGSTLTGEISSAYIWRQGCSHGHSLSDLISSLRSTLWRFPHLNSTTLIKLPVYRLWQVMLSCMQTRLPTLWKVALAFGSSL